MPSPPHGYTKSPYQARKEPEKDTPKAYRAVASEGEIFHCVHFGKFDSHLGAARSKLKVVRVLELKKGVEVHPFFGFKSTKVPLYVAPGRGKSQEPSESFLRRGKGHKASDICFSEFILRRVARGLCV